MGHRHSRTSTSGAVHIVGAAAVAAGLIIALALLAGPGVALLLIVLGLLGVAFAAGALLTTRRQPKVSARVLSGTDPGAARRALAALDARVAGRLPGDVLVPARRLTIAMNELLTRAEREGRVGGDEDIYVLCRMATNYLPETLDAYVRLPREYAQTREVGGGRTAHDLVLEQLAVLQRRLGDVGEAMLKGDADALAAHGRFLENRFDSSHSLLLEAAAATPAAPSVPATDAPGSPPSQPPAVG